MNLKDYHYLYVEDDPMSRDVMALIMETMLGVEMLTIFADSTDFLPRLFALVPAPDIILLDIRVEPHNGFTLLDMIRSQPQFRGRTVVAVTASVMNEQVSRLHDAGFDGAIGKPLTASTFPELLHRIASGEPVWHIT